MLAEDHDHRNDPDYHAGGSLWDLFTGTVETAWNYATSYVEPLQWVQNAWDWAHGYQKTDKIPESTKKRVDAIGEAQKKASDRKNTLHGWLYDKDLSTDDIAFYRDEEGKQLHAVVRGTHGPDSPGGLDYADLWEDGKILLGLAPKTEEIQQALIDAVDKYSDNYDLDCIGYSMGGAQITTIFTDMDPEVKDRLDQYTDIVLVNPGGSSANSVHVKEILNDDRTTLLSNRSDVISQVFTTNVTDNDRWYAGPHTYHPLFAHQWEQFGTDPPVWEGNEPGISSADAATMILD